MEIQVGEYIRTKIGTIGKIKRIDFDEIDKSLKWYIYDKKDYITGIVGERAINKPYIKSHSFNIIDLIEEGDYVNGCEVVPILGYDENGNDIDEAGILKLHDDNDVGLFYLEEVNIKSIVTKEQFKSMEYEVK